jgi:flagellar hook-length control protein FliK
LQVAAATNQAAPSADTPTASQAVVPAAAPATAATSFSNLLTDLDAMPMQQQPLQPGGNGEQFAKGLAERVLFMADGGLQSARIKLHPEHLGPLDIRIQVQDDGARVWFQAQHGQTREALEQAMPRLRELFSDQGMQLLGADVGSGQERPGAEPGQNETGESRDWLQPPVSDAASRGRSKMDVARYIARRMLDIYV